MKAVNKLQQETLVSLQKKLDEQQLLIAQLKQQNSHLLQQLHLLKISKYGRRSECFDGTRQLDFFDELTLEPQDIEPEVEETVTVTKKVKKTTGKKALPKDLPFVEEVHDLTEEQKQCECGCTMKSIGDEVTERLDILPKLVYRVIHIRKKYACSCDGRGVKTASLPEQVLPQSIATPGLISAVVDAKFNRHMPLYRQEDEFKRLGLSLSRATLSNWFIKTADLLKPLIKIMHAHILEYDIAYADETTLQVLKKDKAPKSKSYMWLFMGGPPDKRAALYQYHPNRAEKIALDFFDGFSGYVHADCYRAYINLAKLNDIKHVACWAHARRKFMDIVKTAGKKKGLANQAMTFISSLYDIERNLKEEKATNEHILKVRDKSARRILEVFKTWLDEKIIKVPPKSPVAKAMAYCLNHWRSLLNYLEDGRLEVDNNRSERSIKPFVIGRKNWLFHGNEVGAQSGAIFYSLIETCKQNNVDVFSYFKYLLTHIRAAKTLEQLEALLPYNVEDNHLKSMRDIPKLNYPSA